MRYFQGSCCQVSNDRAVTLLCSSSANRKQHHVVADKKHVSPTAAAVAAAAAAVTATATTLAGGLCEIDLLFMEHHPAKMRSADGLRMKLKDMEKIFARMRSIRPSCRVNITNLDDESYVNGKVIPLPTWHQTPEQQAKG
jgi:hypothetical protein